MLEKTLESPLDSEEINQLTLKEINPEYSLEGLKLKLKLQYFGHLMWRADLLENTLLLGKTEDRRWKGRQRMRWFNGITISMDISLRKCREIVKDREAWRDAVHGVTKSQTRLSNWTTTTTQIQKTNQWLPKERQRVVGQIRYMGLRDTNSYV